jgi:mono/diheme cytochrome c family protein
MALLVGCGVEGSVDRTPSQAGGQQALTAQQLHGQSVWFNSTFGGEKFFTLILPGPPFNLPIGLGNALTSPRDTRFDNWGLINDPGCVPGNALTGGLDICADPNSAGVVGVRKFPNPNYTPTNGQPPVLIGVACAGCHAGLDPQNPPANPNHPSWANIHPTVGNQFIQIGKIFGANLSTHDPRKQVFNSWAPGTVDTTAIENDGINNPGIITQFFNFPNRPFFNLHYNGAPISVHRAGQGGEDDAGCALAATRVYFNIGMCAAECMVPHLANGPGGTQTPIDLNACAAACPDFNAEQAAVNDMCAFIQTTTAPKLENAPQGNSFIDLGAIDHGDEVFNANCASCHSNGQRAQNQVWSDDLLHPVDPNGGVVGTNSCRSRTTNWQTGHIWAAFSSDEQRNHTFGQPGQIRDVPLLAVWATAPFLHNNRLGIPSSDSTVAGRVNAFEEAMSEMLNPTTRTPFVAVTNDVVCFTPDCSVNAPPGTPVAFFADVAPDHFTSLCPGGVVNPQTGQGFDAVENEGHYFGATLSAADKYALIEYLKTL